MIEHDAVKKALLLSGFVNGGHSFFFQDTDKAVYIPVHATLFFTDAIDYFQTYAFYRYATREERKIYYITARRLEKLQLAYLIESVGNK